MPRPWPHGVNIDGTLILDFDEEKVLAGLELRAPMSEWKGKTAAVQPLGKPGDILLSGGLSGSIDRNWPVVISKDVQRDMARISFGTPKFTRAVALSEKVSALLHDDHLAGFWSSFGR